MASFGSSSRSARANTLASTTGQIPYRRVGRYRRILLDDVLAYRRRRSERKAMLADMAAEAQDLGIYDEQRVVAFVALLDASVLHPWVVCDLLLRLAERGLYRPAWSAEILDELVDSLTERKPEHAERFRRRREQMEAAFAEAATWRVVQSLTLYERCGHHLRAHRIPVARP